MYPSSSFSIFCDGHRIVFLRIIIKSPTSIPLNQILFGLLEFIGIGRIKLNAPHSEIKNFFWVTFTGFYKEVPLQLLDK